jgi:hypothetical protein
MSEKMKTSRILTWIFFLVITGSLIAAGIYLEKVMVLGPSLGDRLRALAFGLLGVALLGAIMFAQKQEA